MNTKTKNKDDTKLSKNIEVNLDNEVDEVVKETPVANVITTDVDEHFKTLLVGHAQKLSTKSTGRIGFELALNVENKCRYLRLTSNDTGGLFSKEWVKLDDLYEILEIMEVDKPFKSSALKSVMKGGSANNVSFLSAVLRSEELSLILKSKSQFSHLVNPLLINQRDRLSKLKPLPTSSKK
jgi:hypothetical protein